MRRYFYKPIVVAPEEQSLIHQFCMDTS